ncbi:MAG: ribonucleotide-diphosphate reductase subunit beta [Cocleimonas sp.]|nr:ribonucleotide-diphosphate reductase subunit beta [Cocleimonas sp.]
MLNWDNPLSSPQQAKVAPTPSVAAPEVVEKNAEPQTLAASYATSDVIGDMSFDDTGVTLPEVKAPVATPTKAEEQLAEKAIEGITRDETETLNSIAPVKASDKRVINGEADVNQLAPFKYPWAWEYFLNANKNHWTPLDINMAQDIQDYHHKLSDNEKHVYENVLAYLTTSDILAMRNIGLAVMEKMTAPELQIYQARQVYEEALHTWTYQHCIETIGIDQGEIYNRYRVVPAINGKIQLANKRLDSVMRSDMDLRDPKNLNEFVMAYIFFAAIFEGTWFYNGFTPIFSLQRRGLMKGTSEQLQYIMRDEVMHASFGIRVVKQIMLENDVTLDPQAIRDMWDESEKAEIDYAHYILRKPILGYTAEDHIEQYRFIANRRARQLGLEEPYPNAQNRTPWLDEQANMKKEKNFFETRVTEYQTGGALDWG